MNDTYHNQNYSRKQIEAVLSTIKKCIENDQFLISMNENRQENIAFINEYNIYPKKRKEVLLQIKIEDFCHSLKNTKPGYEHEILYVFVPQVELFNTLGEKEKMGI